MPVLAAPQSCPTCTLFSLQPKEPTLKRTARVKELLRGNHAPLDVELDDFHLILETSPEILQDLDQKIAQAKEMLDYLVTARHQAEQHMNDAKSLLHPMRSLPTEVMSEIFSHCVPSLGYIDEGCLDSLDPRLAPWTLSHVCYRWRSLALSSPQLWTYFELDFDEHLTLLTTRQSIYKMILFFERSKGLPLTLDISNGQFVNTTPVFAVLETTIPRWKDLSFDHGTAWSLQSLSGSVFPCLERLFFPPDVAAMHTELTVFNRTSTPALRVFEASDARIPWTSFGSVPLPWSQLTTIIDFPAFDPDGLRQLREAQNLEHLAVVVGVHYAAIDGVFSLPRLCRLSVTEDEDAEAGRLKEFLSALDMPALQDLTLEFTPAESYRVFHFPISLDRATKTLTRLHINHVGCNAIAQHSENTNNLLQFLSHTECVEELIIHNYALTVDFISGLKVCPPLSRLPRLHVLDMGGCLSREVFSQNTLEIYSALQSRLDHRDSPEVAVNTPATRSADDDPRVYLERLCVPRWLFSRQDGQWKDICRSLKVECGLTR